MTYTAKRQHQLTWTCVRAYRYEWGINTCMQVKRAIRELLIVVSACRFIREVGAARFTAMRSGGQ